MNAILKKIEALQEFKDNLNDIVRFEIVNAENAITNMNAQIQLYEQGVNRNGVQISSYRPYRQRTIQIKLKKGQPTNRVTLKDEGLFYASFVVRANELDFVIDATDWKTEELVTKYGSEILGLTDENLGDLIWTILYPAILNILRDNV